MSPMSAPARADAKVRTEMFRWMRLARKLEERLEGLLGPIGGPFAGTPLARERCAGRGQEAVSVGTCLHAREDDVVAPSHRDAAVFLMRGIPPERIIAQCLGKASGVTRGRDGDMHMGDMGRRVIAAAFHLADTVPVAAGAALALKMTGTDAAALCVFDERAAGRGDWHEGINFAAAQTLPVVYVCSTDEGLRATSWRREFAVDTIAEKAVAYGIPGVTVDGTDVIAVYEAVGDAMARARAGEGPSIVEALVFRASLREESPEGAAAGGGLSARRGGDDPIERLAVELVGAKLIDRKTLDEIDSAIERQLDDAFAWAVAQPDPAPEDCLEGVYAGAGPGTGDAGRRKGT